MCSLGKPPKKSSTLNSQAIKRGGDNFFKAFFKTLLLLKKLFYFRQLYGNITLKFVSVGILTGLLQYFSKNRAILVQKFGEEKDKKFLEE